MERRRGLFLAVGTTAVAAVLVLFWAVMGRYAVSRSSPVPLPVRRIAAVYVAARLCSLEKEFSPYKDLLPSARARFRRYVEAGRNESVPSILIPDLDDYDVADAFLTDPKSVAPSLVVIAEKEGGRSHPRLIVSADGTIKAVATTEPLVGRKLDAITAPIYDVTPETGIVAK